VIDLAWPGVLSLSIDAAGVDAYRFKNALGRVAFAHESRRARCKRMLTSLGSRTQANDGQIRPEPASEYHAVARVIRAPVPIQQHDVRGGRFNLPEQIVHAVHEADARDVRLLEENQPKRAAHIDIVVDDENAQAQ
jgi:hypothetical protein